VRRALASTALLVGAGCVLACGALSGCGYALSTRWVGKGGAKKVEVRLFQNRSTEPGLGSVMTDALREGLARRGALSASEAPSASEGQPGSPEESARLEGEVGARQPTASSADAKTSHIGIEVRARLVVGAQAVAEGTFAREADYLAGDDPVESEGRRALALRRLAEELAPEILAAFER
jgi:hypothetical protein